MSAACDRTAATAGGGDTHPWGGASSEPAIMHRLLRGAQPVCIGCGRALERGEPRVTVPRGSGIGPAVLVRCGDCEYRSVYG